MSRKLLVAASFMLVAAIAQAQPKPPKRPTPPAVPAPNGVLDLAHLDDLADLRGLEVDLADLRADFDLDLAPMMLNLRPMLAGITADALDSARLAGQLADLDALQERTSGQRVYADASASGSREYSRGTSYLDQGRYDQAVQAFDKVIAANDKRADGAMYWKGYALNRLGRGSEALATLDELLKKFPTSRWANDAKALQVEVKQASGRPVNPSQQGDDELKLIALNGLMSRDPERGIPMVEQILAGSASPRMKERALFVLAQSGSPKAKTILTDIAKGKGNPDLQMKALDYLGAFGGGPDVPLLVDIYKSSPDIDVKKRVIRSLGSAGRRGFAFGLAIPPMPPMAPMPMPIVAGQPLPREDVERAQEEYQRAMVEAQRDVERARQEAERARQEADRAARDEQRTSGVAIARTAGSSDRDKAREAKAKEASDALWGLYQGEQSVELKREILRNMYFGDQADRLVQVARTEKDASIRRSALQAMMFSRTPKTADTLAGLYREEKDPTVKRQIIDVLATMESAGPLIQLARQENDPELKRTLVQRISFMKDKEATDFMMEILKK
jgi:tetratricopeptide (TPR) repeat protein